MRPVEPFMDAQVWIREVDALRALARALLKDPPILVLDEATSMFDPEGEKEFIEECSEALQNRTVILVTHRESSLGLADRVVEIGLNGPFPPC